MSQRIYVAEREPLDSFEGMQPWLEYVKAVPDHDKWLGDALDKVTKDAEVREEFAVCIPAPWHSPEPWLFMRIRKMEDGGRTYLACRDKELALSLCEHSLHDVFETLVIERNPRTGQVVELTAS